MMKPEIYYGGDFTLDLSQIKAIKKDYEMKIIIFELKTRAEYGVNPFTEIEEMILVSETPEFSLWITTTRSSVFAYASQIEPDISLLPSSTRISSKSLYSCPRILSTQRFRNFSAL